jgi:NADPH:quinone reductase-like Zn-dependent oxidoreductase
MPSGVEFEGVIVFSNSQGGKTAVFCISLDIWGEVSVKAVVLHEYGGPDKLKHEDWEDPVIGERQVLVRVSAAGVNPIDYKLRSGAMKAFMPINFPIILGYDFSGVVRAVGPKVTEFAPGDKVFGRASGTYAQLVVADVPGVAKLPEHLDLVDAAALPVITNTGEQIITRGTKIEHGQTIVVTGAVGAVGRTAVWVARKAGAVVIAAVRGSQMKEAAELEANDVIALDDAASLDKLGFVDAVADTVGGDVGETMIGKVKPGGIFATVVGPPANAKLHPTVKVEMVQSTPDAGSMRSLAEAVAAGHLVIPIDRMVPLEDAASAHAAAEKGGIGKVLLIA